MDINGIMKIIMRILDESKAAILVTVDSSGRPHSRWMTPTILNGRSGTIFAVTSPQFAKAIQLQTHPGAEWMLQTRALDEIVNIKCKINIIDNPSVKNEVLEALGNKLSVFWKINHEAEFVVLETVLEEVTYFQPMKGIRETIGFSGREENQ